MQKMKYRRKKKNRKKNLITDKRRALAPHLITAYIISVAGIHYTHHNTLHGGVFPGSSGTQVHRGSSVTIRHKAILASLSSQPATAKHLKWRCLNKLKSGPQSRWMYVHVHVLYPWALTGLDWTVGIPLAIESWVKYLPYLSNPKQAANLAEFEAYNTQLGGISLSVPREYFFSRIFLVFLFHPPGN
jgi:hypothetical protein